MMTFKERLKLLGSILLPAIIFSIATAFIYAGISLSSLSFGLLIGVMVGLAAFGIIRIIQN